MSHVSAILNAQERNKDSLTPAKLASDQSHLIGTIVVELPAEYDPHSPTFAPHIFPNRLYQWEESINRLSPAEAAQQLSNILPLWSRNYHDFVIFDPREKCMRNLTMSILDHLTESYTLQEKQNPEGLAIQAIEEQKRCALLAMERFKAIFERLCTQHPQETLAAIQTIEQEKFERAVERLNGFMDLQAIKANLEASIQTSTEPRI